MDSEHFDHLVSRLGTAGTRRRLLRLSALPLAGGLAAFLSDDNESAAKNKKKKHKRKRCKSKEEVCAGKCGRVTYKCNGKKKTVDCGSCKCDVCASGCDFTSVQAAIDAADPGDTIKLCLELFTEDIEIDKDLTIIGSHALLAQSTLQGTGKNRVVVVHRGTVRLESLWITGGNGGIANSGTLTLHNCSVLENTANFEGGGIHNGGALEMTGGLISGNSADYGGGIYNYGGKATLTDCLISGNNADSGGGVYNGGTLEMTNSSVDMNTAVDAGGIFNDRDATVKLNNSTVSENTAVAGGGIVNLCSTSTCAGGSSVSGNTPDDCTTFGDGVLCPVGTSSCDGC